MNLIKFKKIYQILGIILLFNYGCNIPKHDENIENVIETYHSVNLNIERFPKNYSVLDRNILYNVLPNLLWRPSTQGEFETKEEFISKIKKLDDKMYQTKIIDNLTIDSLFTIDLENADLNYDADSAIMNIDIYLGLLDKPWPGWNAEESETIIYDNAIEIYGHGENPYQIRSLLVTKHKEYPNMPYLKIKLKMDRDYAQREKENIKVVTTIKLLKPWYWCRYSGLITREYVFAEILQFWIYNFKTGEIYKKIRFNN